MIGLLVGVGYTSAVADSQADRTVARDTWVADETTIVFGEPMNNVFPGMMFAEKKDVGYIDRKLCGNTPINECAGDGYFFDYRAIFPPCANVLSNNCIDGVWAVDESGQKIEGSLFETWDAPDRFPGDVAKGIPASGGSSLWKIPKANGSGSDIFAVVVGESGRLWSMEEPKAFVSDSFASIQPVEILPRDPNEGRTAFYDAPYPDGIGANIGFDGQGAMRCEILELTRCAARESFIGQSRYGIRIRFQNAPLEWFRGRLAAPEVSLTKSPTGQNILELVAAPMTVPFVSATAKWGQLSAETQALYGKPIEQIRRDHGTSLTSPGASGEKAFSFFKGWLPLMNDQAAAMKTYWSLHSLNLTGGAAQQQMRTCSQGKSFAGIVTSNAAIYSDGAPVLNPVSESLEYKVAAPHFTSSGDVFSGTYDLKIQSDVARCIYGFSKAPIKASIEITSETGTVRVATTTVSESDGFMNLHASGFTYSSPTIKVKITQDKVLRVVVPAPVAPAPLGTPAPVVAKPALKSITCVKGKTIKKVTAVNPKCPVGYKKK